MIKKIHSGYILPGTIVLSMIIITLVGYLYQQSVVQHALTKNLIQQVAIYAECNSLIPILRKQLNKESLDNLKTPKKSFLSVSGMQGTRWVVDRSQLRDKKIQFMFHHTDTRYIMEPIQITIKYSKP